MIRLFKQKDSDFLSNQTPRKRISQKKPRRSLKKQISLLTLLCVVIFCYFYWENPFHKNTTPKLLTTSTPWEVTVLSSKEAPLNKEKERELLSKTKRLAGNKTFFDIDALAKMVQKEHSFEQVNIIQNRPHKLLVFVKERTPVMQVRLHKLMLLSSQGEVYGSPSLPEEKSLPILEGFFSSRRKRHKTLPNNSLQTTVKEQRRLKEALQLYSLLKNQNLPVLNIQHKKHRGFFVTLKEKNILVAFGTDLFKVKVEKLIKALKLNSKNRPIERIDLDYLGKAFIKRKTA